MKIALCSNGAQLSDNLAESLAQTPYIIVVDTETAKIKTICNKRHYCDKYHCQKRTARKVLESGAQVLIAGQVSQEILPWFKRKEIFFFNQNTPISAQEALHAYQATALHITR